MRLFLVFALCAVLLHVDPLLAAEPLRRPSAGLPGTATPQPYSQPQVRPLGNSNRNPPLLNSPAQHRQMAPPQPLPKDRPLPQLEPQRQANPQHPAEQLD